MVKLEDIKKMFWEIRTIYINIHIILMFLPRIVLDRNQSFVEASVFELVLALMKLNIVFTFRKNYYSLQIIGCFIFPTYNFSVDLYFALLLFFSGSARM